MGRRPLHLLDFSTQNLHKVWMGQRWLSFWDDMRDSDISSRLRAADQRWAKGVAYKTKQNREKEKLARKKTAVHMTTPHVAAASSAKMPMKEISASWEETNIPNGVEGLAELAMRKSIRQGELNAMVLVGAGKPIGPRENIGDTSFGAAAKVLSNSGWKPPSIELKGKVSLGHQRLQANVKQIFSDPSLGHKEARQQVHKLQEKVEELNATVQQYNDAVLSDSMTLMNPNSVAPFPMSPIQKFDLRDIIDKAESSPEKSTQ